MTEKSANEALKETVEELEYQVKLLEKDREQLVANIKQLQYEALNKDKCIQLLMRVAESGIDLKCQELEPEINGALKRKRGN